MRRFVEELLARVRRAGHTGPVIIRADSGFENHKLMKQLARQGVEFSIGVKQSKTIRALIAQIPEEDWITIANYPETGEAQIAETTLGDFRLIVRRTRLVGAQAELFPTGVITRSRPTAPSRPSRPISITATTPRSSTRSAISKTKRSAISPPGRCTPTARGP